LTQNRPSARRLYGLITLMVIFWALSFVIGKYSLRQVPALMIPGLRAAIASLCLLLIYIFQRHEQPRLSRADWPVLFVISLFGVTLNQLLFIVGLNRTSVGHAAVVIALTPIFVLLLAAFAGHETITPRKIVGMLIGLAGVYALQTAHGGSGRAATLAGDSLLLMGALAFSIYTTLSKHVTARYGAITINTYAYLGSAIILAPLTVWQFSLADLSRIDPVSWLGVLYMGLFPSAVCYLIYYYALTYVPASKVAAFSYLQPVLATSLAILLLGEHVTSELIAGGALVLAGVWVTERAA
jgi:drug/metabolite transporter (DMT)-like permease